MFYNVQKDNRQWHHMKKHRTPAYSSFVKPYHLLSNFHPFNSFPFKWWTRKSKKLGNFHLSIISKESIFRRQRMESFLKSLNITYSSFICSIIGYIEILSEVLWNKDQHNISGIKRKIASSYDSLKECSGIKFILPGSTVVHLLPFLDFMNSNWLS